MTKKAFEKIKEGLLQAIEATKTMPPDFKTYEERDAYFREHADYFTVVKKTGVGHYSRDEYKTLEEAERAAQTKATISGGGWMIYAVIDSQSAFVTSVPISNSKV
jgi:hypothetical protein